ncbi:CAP domain-containing protein [Levilactobacillus paucivorans]|nr:CAP domain-containing protein [Levilactobacillus paucivorans]
MKAQKIIFSTLTVLGIAVMGLSAITTPADTALAKAKAAKMVKTTTYKSKRKVHVRGSWMYSNTTLTHKTHHMTKYLYTKFYATKKVTLRKANGKVATYNYLKSKDGKVKGYVASTYVWNKWGYGKYSVKAYWKSAVAAINEDRVAQGLKPYKEDPKLDKIAQKNSDRMLKDGSKFKRDPEGTPHAGWIQDHYIAPKSNPIVHYKNGREWGIGSENSWMHRSDIDRPAFAVPYLMSAKHTSIGLGGTQHGEAVYEFVLFSHKD